MKKIIIVLVSLNLFLSCNNEEDNVIIEVTTEDFESSINENPAPNQEIGYVVGSTNNGEVIFEIESQNPESAFSIDTESGLLTVSDATLFDFELNPSINGTVRVSNGDVFADASITISMNDIEDSMLTVENFEAEINENPENDQILGSISATTDQGTLSFLIENQQPEGAFQIDESTGELSVSDRNLFDFELNEIITGTIKVSNGAIDLYSNVTITLIDIEEEENTENPRVFAYNNSSQKIMELNLDDGSEIGVIADLMFDNVNFTNMVYSKATDEIIVTFQVTTAPFEFDFYFARIDVTNGQVNLNLVEYEDYKGFTMTNDGKLYTHKTQSNDRKILELDPMNGSVIRIVADIDYQNRLEGYKLGYSEATEEIIGIQASHRLAKIDPVTGAFSSCSLIQSSDFYHQLIVTDNGTVYGYILYDDRIVQLDCDSGSQVDIINLIPSNFRYISYSETTNELIGMLVYGLNPRHYDLSRVNIENGQTTQAPLQTSASGNIYDFILIDQ